MSMNAFRYLIVRVQKYSGVSLFFLALLWFSMISCLEIQGQQRSTEVKADFYAEISANRDSIVVGDSCIVSVILYSNLPCESVEQMPRNLQFAKDVRVHLIPTDREQQQVRTSRGVYYALAWQHYRVSRKDLGIIVWPEMQFSAEVGIYQAVEDDFWNFFSFAPTMRLIEKRKVKCKAPKFSLPVVERPKRSTQDILRSGRQVM